MQIQVQIQGETDALLEKMAALSHFRKYAVMKNVSELLRSSTLDRVRSTQSPDGMKWAESARAERTGGLTLTETSILKNSIHSIASGTGAAVGTNTIYAATHQFGAEDRTIRAKKGKYLRFQTGNGWVTVEKVTVNIPARPFLGISEEDQKEIREEFEAELRRKG